MKPGDKTGNGSPPINPHMSQTLDPQIPKISPHQAASTNIPYHNLSRGKLAPSIAGNITYHDLDSASNCCSHTSTSNAKSFLNSP